MGRIAISTESVADVPVWLKKQKDIKVIYLRVHTEEGIFTDTLEISDRNVIEYMAGGEKKCKSIEPFPLEYRQYFEWLLQTYDEVVHITISSGISDAYKYALEAVENMDANKDKIHVVDSRHLSSGQCMLVMEAVKLRALGKSAEEIAASLNRNRDCISTSFICRNADYLYYNDRVSEFVMNVCQRLNVHPVLYMKEGKLTVKRLFFGDYNKIVTKYIQSELKKNSDIDMDYAFLTHAGCRVDILNRVKSAVDFCADFKTIETVTASAAVSCNCGPDTVGIIFRRRETA